jgi:hypothetical protein
LGLSSQQNQLEIHFGTVVERTVKNQNVVRVTWVACAVLLVLLLTFAANAGNVLVIDEPRPSDLIVVLAGETDVRPAHALQLLSQGYAHRVLIDVPAGAKIYKFTQLDLARKYIQELPQASSVDVCPIEGLSTRDESRDVAACLSHETANKILIVTSDFHTRRSLSIFRHEIPGKIFAIAAARDATQFGVRWWQHRQWSKTCVDEWLRLIWWNVVERWS